MAQDLPRAEYQSQGSGSGYSVATADTVLLGGGLEVAKGGLRTLDDDGSSFDVASQEDDIIVLAGTDNNGGTYTLADDDTVNGRVIIVSDYDNNAGTNGITVDTESSQNIDGSTSVSISTNGSQLRVVSDGSNWYTL